MAAGDGADLRHLERIAHFRLAEHDFFFVGAQHPFERGAHIRHRLVDDLVELDLDAFALCRRTRLVVRAHVEADDDRARRLGEQDVALGHGADRALDDLDLHFGVRELRERVGERFRRAALVRLDEQLERALLAFRRVGDEILE